MTSALTSSPSFKSRSHYLKYCQEIVGSQYVITNDELITASETATFATSQQVRFIIQPGSSREVQACLKAARNFGVSIHPISRGYNWGYGSQVPSENFSVIMDLSRLDSIQVDSQNATVTLGSGVTQQQLFEYLRSHYPHLLFSLTGSSPDSSVIGNAIDGGYANGLDVIRWDRVIALEAILPSGKLLKTGFDDLPNAATAGLSRYGLGADLKGLFRQSNFGVVTAMTLELSLLPEYLQIFYFAIDREAQLGELIDRLRDLKQTGLIQSNWILLHGYRILAEVSQFPWQEASEEATLDRNLMLKILRQQQIPIWSGVYNGIFAVYSPTIRHAQAAKADLHAALKNQVSRLKSVTVDKTQIKKLRWNQNLPLLELTHELLKGRLLTFAGIPGRGSIPIGYWRKRGSIPEVMDLDRDRCGFIWIAVTAPVSGEDALTIVAVIERLFNDCGFEPQIVLDGVNKREMYVMTSLVYDREVADLDYKARICFEKVTAELKTMGYYPYRLPKPLFSPNTSTENHNSYISVFNELQSSLLENTHSLLSIDS